MVRQEVTSPMDLVKWKLDGGKGRHWDDLRTVFLGKFPRLTLGFRKSKISKSHHCHVSLFPHASLSLARTTQCHRPIIALTSLSALRPTVDISWSPSPWQPHNLRHDAEIFASQWHRKFFLSFFATPPIFLIHLFTGHRRDTPF